MAYVYACTHHTHTHTHTHTHIAGTHQGVLLAAFIDQCIGQKRPMHGTKETLLAAFIATTGPVIDFFLFAGTHQGVLLAAFLATTGPVIEFGMGHFSTPLLHELCRASGRLAGREG